jgi:hypothetical protein
MTKEIVIPYIVTWKEESNNIDISLASEILSNSNYQDSSKNETGTSPSK